MSTRVTRELTYAAPPAEVHRMLTTVSFREEVCTRLGVVSATATARQRDGAVTVEVVELDVRVQVPLVGRRLEALVAELLGRALDVEHETGRDYLSA